MQLIDSLPPRFREALNRFLRNLDLNMKGEYQVYLFGSLARGDYLLDSDIDLIVVSDQLAQMKPWERTAYLRRLAPANVGFDIIGYTREEFERAKERFPEIKMIKTFKPSGY
ncbi:hypothetical protein DRO48_03065 [Candidatus Bathyarchaeota archaeon]|nr:MAG: hypothetical protein DRO48_03065 [Candidatus Bathyarchaeota archaeon]